MKIWAHTLVKNEEKYLWYAVTSVIDFVDRILLWDTGSTDKTVKTINELQKRYPDQVDFKEVGDVTPGGFSRVRQEMLDNTMADWFVVLDGDEVWWEDSIKKVIDIINRKGNSIDSIVVPMIYPVGDIYRRQEERAGKYHLAGKTGHYALRGVNRNIPGLSSQNPHGTWGWVDENKKMIQDRDPDKILLVKAPYMHFSLLPRGATREEDVKVVKRAGKLKYEMGEAFPKDFFYPEAFFRPRPGFVSSPWRRMDRQFFIKALIQTPFRKIKRRFSSGKVGY